MPRTHSLAHAGAYPDLPVFRLSNRRAYTSSYRERASGIMRSFRQTRRTDGQDINPDPLHSLALNLAGDDAIVAIRESTDESSSPASVSDHGVRAVKRKPCVETCPEQTSPRATGARTFSEQSALDHQEIAGSHPGVRSPQLPERSSRAAKEKGILHSQRFFEEDFLAGLESCDAQVQNSPVQHLHAMLRQDRGKRASQPFQLLKGCLA
jgi:hypothetical protein